MNQTISKIACLLLCTAALQANAQNTFPASGNVGIGTTAPATPMHIVAAHGNTQARLTLPAGSNGAGTGDVNLQLWVSEPGITWEGAGIGTNVTNNGAAPTGFGRINAGLGQSYIRFITNGGGMAFNTMANNGAFFPTMYMVNGSVGIGTTAPATLLHMSGAHGNTQTRLTLPAANNGAGTGDVNLQLWVSEPGVTWEGGGVGTNVTNDGGGPAGFGRLNTGLGQSYIRFITNGGAMAFNTTNNAGAHYPTMYMANGAVGIGTTTPAATLDVSGTVKIGAASTPAGYKLYVETGILTEKVKVAVKTSADWSDHVFNKQYPLLPIQQLEQFINTNNHLPGIPSADEMVKEGNDLSKTDARLLEKIEELTLYIIAQQKKMEALEKTVRQLQEKR